MKKDKLLVLYDVIVVILSLYFALLLQFNFSLPYEYVYFFKLSIIPVVVITLFANKIFNLYDSVWSYASVQELVSIVYSVSVANILFILYSYAINYKLLRNQYYRFPLAVHVIFWIVSIISLGGIRFVNRMFYEKSKQTLSVGVTKNLLVIGAGDAAVLLLKEIKRNKNLNYNIVGLIDDDVNKQNKYICGYKVLGGRNDIVKLSQKYKIEVIIMALPSAGYHEKRDIFNICKNAGCELKTLPGIDDMLQEKLNVSSIREINIEDLLGRKEVRLNNDNIKKFIAGKVVLVTGGGGSIGSELCRQIAKFNPEKLLILDIYENNAYDLQMELNYKYPNLKKEVIIASVRDKKRLDEIFKRYKPEVIFHAAAHKHVPLMEDNPKEAIKNNVIGTYNVVRCCNENNVKRFVLISTDKAVNPTNIMGASKRFCELIIQAYNTLGKTEFVAVRFGNVLGSNGSVIPLFKKQIAHGGPITVTHPEINRFFMTIPEAAQLVIQAGAIAHGGEIFVLDMGEPVKILDLANDLIRLSGLKPDKDIKIEFTGLRPGEKLYEEPLMSEVALTTTEHDKIRVEKPIDVDVNFIDDSIKEFENKLVDDEEKIFELMQQKVTTYTRKTK